MPPENIRLLGPPDLGSDSPIDPSEGAPTPTTAPDPLAGRVKGPWADAKVGDYVKLKSSAGPIMTMKVVQVDDLQVSIEMTTEIPDQPDFKVPPQKMVQQRFLLKRGEEDPAAPGNSKKIGEESITIAGRKLDCEIYEVKTAMRGKTLITRTYICKDVPGWTVRIDNDSSGEMQTVTEVIEFRK